MSNNSQNNYIIECRSLQIRKGGKQTGQNHDKNNDYDIIVNNLWNKDSTLSENSRQKSEDQIGKNIVIKLSKYDTTNQNYSFSGRDGLTKKMFNRKGVHFYCCSNGHD